MFTCSVFSQRGKVDLDGRAGVGVGGSVVHQDVERAEPLQRRVHARLGVLRPAHVARLPGDVSPDLVSRGLAGLRLARDDHDARARLGEALGDAQTDAP